jgi:hypothetical protein
MKKLAAAAIVVGILLLLGALAYLAVAAPAQPCDFGPCVVR